MDLGEDNKSFGKQNREGRSGGTKQMEGRSK